MSITEQRAFIRPSDELVSDRDYLQLSRLVTEHVWLVDNGHADRVHELYTEDGQLDLVGPEPLQAARPFVRGASRSQRTRRGS